MIPYRVYDHINIGPVTIYAWGFFVGLGFIVGLFYALKEAKKRGIDQKEILNLAIFIFIGAIFGARLGYVLQFIGPVLAESRGISAAVQYVFWGLFRIYEGGLMFYGGLIGAILLGILYLIFSGGKFVSTRGKFAHIRELSNIIAPGLALGLAIGRIGCILVNEHQGSPTSLPWAILWPDGVARHPVGIYLSLNAFILFLILRRIKNCPEKSSTSLSLGEEGKSNLNDPNIATPTLILPLLAGGGGKEGVVKNLFVFFLLYYSVSRFFLDFTRSQGVYLSDPHFFGLTTSQYISLTIFIVIVIILLRKKLVFDK